MTPTSQKEHYVLTLILIIVLENVINKYMDFSESHRETILLPKIVVMHFVLY